jgi:hypothetical protein
MPGSDFIPESTTPPSDSIAALLPEAQVLLRKGILLKRGSNKKDKYIRRYAKYT